jgi:hypothetical protein
MKREILCPACGAKAIGMDPEDVANGFKQRLTHLRVGNLPVGHGLTVNNEFIPIDKFLCDQCNREIKLGEPAVARTMWNTNREDEPRMWEDDYKQ